MFIVLYRIGGANSKLRKYTIGPYGRVTLHQARVATQRVFAAKLEGRDPAAEKRAAKRRVVADRVGDLLEMFIAQRLSQNRSGSKGASKSRGARTLPEQGLMPTIALVDDERNILTSVSILLEAEGYRIMTYTDGASALDGFKTNPFT